MQPEVTLGSDGETLRHPAFGTIVLTQIHGGAGSTLFGSEVAQHMGRMGIKIQRAELCRKDSHDFLFPKETICEFEMTHAQFAQFIVGVGKGSGTPITLTTYREGRGVQVPPIENFQSRSEKASENVRQGAKTAIAELQKQVRKLEELVESGKVGKRELAAAISSIRHAVNNVPENFVHVTESAEAALEAATAAAKGEIEAFVQATALRLGMERISAEGSSEPLKIVLPEGK